MAILFRALLLLLLNRCLQLTVELSGWLGTSFTEGKQRLSTLVRGWINAYTCHPHTIKITAIVLTVTKLTYLTTLAQHKN